jgi:K+-transporting ATPase c subunit
MRLRHKGNGAVVNVDEETGSRLLGGAWESADSKPRARRTAKKADEDASGNDQSG